MVIRVLVVDDHPVSRAGVLGLCERAADLELVGEAASAKDARIAIEEDRPDVVVLDISLPDQSGLAVLPSLLPCRVIMLSVHDDALYRERAQQLGAAAFVSKSASLEELGEAVRRVAAGESFFSVPDAPGRAAVPAEVWEGLEQLSPAEREVLRRLADNLTSREIAAQLFVSVRTVQNHRNHICTKLGLRGSNRLLEVALALRPVLDP